MIDTVQPPSGPSGGASPSPAPVPLPGAQLPSQRPNPPSGGSGAFLRRANLAEYRDQLLHSWLVTLTALGFSLVPLFLILDWFTMPAELWTRFARYRAVVTLAVLAQFVVVRKTAPSRWSFLHGYLFAVIVSGMIVRMTVDLGGFNSAYYAGLNLVVVATILLLPWGAVHSAVTGALVIAMYLIANFAWGGPYSTAILINNVYFLAGTLVIGVAINHLKQQLIEKEFRLRSEVLDANENLDRSRLELKAARDALWGEMEVAKRIQTALLPRNQTLGGYAIAAVMQPAAEVGGDYYDVIHTEQGEHWAAVGDVSGHGVESGLVMMMTQTSILSMVHDLAGRSPAEVFAQVNGVVRENIRRLDTARYMTLNLLRLSEGKVTVAGKHQDLLVYRKGEGRVETIVNDGCWIGMVPDVRPFVGDLDIPLAPGDVLLLFTDGVTEATDASGEMFGQDRLAHAFAEVAPLPPEQVVEKLLAAVTSFQKQQEDDITLMVLRRE